jgi:hypothetical protein
VRRLNRSAAVRAAVVGIALILVLAATAALVSPKLIKLAPLRQQLVAQLSAQLHAKVDLASLHVSLLPLPHVVLDQLRLSAAPTLDASIESVAVYPRLLALLTGNLQPAQVSIAGARVQLHLPRESAVEPTTGSATAPRGLREMLAAGLATVLSVAAARAPGLVVRLAHGVLSVTAADGEAFAFTDIHGAIHLPPDRLSVDLAAGSNVWEQTTLRAAIDPASVHGDGRIMMTGLRLQAMSRYLMPADLGIGNATANLDVHLTADGLDALRADVEATVPTLDIFESRDASRLSEVREGSPERPTGVADRTNAGRSPQRAAAHLKLEGAHAKASITVDDQTTGLTFNDLRLAAPPLQLSGTLMLDRRTPHVRLELEGKDLDVANAHEAALFFAAHNRTAQAIFNILRAGKVPRLTLQAQGRTPGELDGLEAMLIRGALVGGQVRIPGNGLELDDVNGEVSVVKGVLIGEHVSARLGNTQARDGSVRVGLTDELPELSVTAAVQADASDLPAVLNRVVASETLTRILERLTNVQGRAEGQLTLRGTTDAATAVVDVSTLSVSAKVRDFDRPVQIDGGTFHYDADAVAASGLKVTTGASILSEVSVHADTGAALARIDISAGSGRIALGEIYPSVAASGWLPDSVWTPKAVSGAVAVESVRVRGPAARPSDWRIEMAGAVERLDVDAPRLRQVTAVRFPVTLSDLRLAHDAVASTLAVRVATADGLTSNLDLGWGAAGLDIRRLSLRDAESNATLSLQLKEREFDMTFAGSLGKATLKTLLPDEHDVPGSMRGDFSARVLMDEPARSTAKGRLEVVHVAVPGPGGVRAHIAHAELHATGGLLAIEAEGDVGDALLLHLHGALRPARDALIADLDVSTGPVEWARLEPLLPPAEHGDRESTPTGSHSLPVRGKVRISADSFTYAGYTWKPVHAVVNLSGGTPSMTITQASLCGIATPGTMAMTPGGASVRFRPAAKNQPLDKMLACLAGAPARMTGQCSLTARIDAAGHGPELLASANGQAQFTARNGRIYRGGVLEKILVVTSLGHDSLNLLSDLTDDGLPYNTIAVKGDLREGKLVLTEATMDAPSMKMVAEGSIDVSRGTIDVTLLAAPFKTVDKVISRIPILGNVVGGSLLTIPVKVKGPLRDPSVTPLDPSEVGDGLLRVMTRIVKLPVRLLDPFLPGSGNP